MHHSTYRTASTIGAFIGVAVVSLFAALALPGGTDQAHAQTVRNCTGAQYQDIDGVVVIEMENVPLSGEWEYATTGGGRFSGFTGDGYLFFNGQNNLNSPDTEGQGGLLEYTVRINTPGEYIIRWYNVVGKGNNNSEHNDSWIKVVGLPVENFYARDYNNPGDVVYPKGSGLTPVPEGGGGQGYFKAYGANSEGWSWGGNTYDNDAHRIFAQFDEAGVYTILVSGRSEAHAIDRLAMYKVEIDPESSDNINKQTAAEREIAEDLTNEETLCEGTPDTGDNDPDDLLVNDSFEDEIGEEWTVNANAWLRYTGSRALEGDSAFVLVGRGTGIEYIEQIVPVTGSEGDEVVITGATGGVSLPSNVVTGSRLILLDDGGSVVDVALCTYVTDKGTGNWGTFDCTVTASGSFAEVQVAVGWRGSRSGFLGIDNLALNITRN